MAKEMPLTKKYGYLWVTLGFFVISLLGHWLFAWPAYVQEQQEHHEAARFAGYFMQTARTSARSTSPFMILRIPSCFSITMPFLMASSRTLLESSLP